MGNVPQAYAPAPQQPTWLSRHWKALVIGIVAFVLVMGALFIGGIALLVFGMIKSSDPYQHAVALAQANPDLQHALGTPIETGWWAGGSINTTPASGNADLVIPIRGPKGKANLYVVARKSAGEWEYERIEAELAGTETRVKLLKAPPQAEEPAPPAEEPVPSEAPQ